jgi:DNA polymerase III delta subunit
MIIFLYGPDDYRRSQKKRDLIAEFTKKRSDLGLAYFDLAAKDWFDGFEEFTKTQSLFASAKLAVFENMFELDNKELVKLLKPFLENEAVTLLIAEREKPVKALGFLLEKPAYTQKFENLEGAEWTAFILAEAKKMGIALSPSAAAFLGTVYQGNSWALATEVQKLSTLPSVTPSSVDSKEIKIQRTMATSDAKASADKTIDKKDLDQFDLEAAPNYWALLNGVKGYDLRTRLYALEKLFATNDPPAKLFNILASQWKEKTPQCAEFDFAIKSGKLDYEDALVDLVLG